jgi:hypothetical protein
MVPIVFIRFERHVERISFYFIHGPAHEQNFLIEPKFRAVH